MIVLSLEGCLSAGKSLLLTTLRCSSLVIKYAVFIVEEPVAECQNVAGENLLELYYTDPARYAFDFQLHCLYTRLQAIRNALTHNITDSRPILLILERSWHSDLECFASLHHQQGHINHIEMNLLRQLVSRETASLPSIDGIIMLDVSLQLAMRRLKARGRIGECTVQPAYLTRLMQEHDKWVNRMPIPYIRVDGSALFQHQPVQHALIDTIVNQIKAFIVVLSDPKLGKKHKNYTRSPVIFPKAFSSRSLLMPSSPVIASIETTTKLNATNLGTIEAVDNNDIIPFYVDSVHPLTHQTTLHQPIQGLIEIKPNKHLENSGDLDFSNFNLDEDWNTYQTASVNDTFSATAISIFSDHLVQTNPLPLDTKPPALLRLPPNNTIPLELTQNNTMDNNPLLQDNITLLNSPLPQNNITVLELPQNNTMDDNPLLQDNITLLNSPLSQNNTMANSPLPQNNITVLDSPLPQDNNIADSPLPQDNITLLDSPLPQDNITLLDNPLPPNNTTADSLLITNGCDQEAHLVLPVISLCAVFEQTLSLDDDTNSNWDTDVITKIVIIKPRKLRLCFCQ